MAVKKRKKRSHRAADAQKERKIDRLAAQLAPLEEKRAPLADEEAVDDRYVDGSMIVDGTRLPIPESFADEDDADGFRIEPVVIAVTALALSFIAFVGYLIAHSGE